MITGFNTDIEYGGVTYHVQTEDKGKGKPIILSLIYDGGTILASKRSPYDDLLTPDFDERALAERLNKQHRLICAAIQAGRIEDLKKMAARESAARESAAAETEVLESLPPIASPDSPASVESPPVPTPAESLPVPEPLKTEIGVSKPLGISLEEYQRRDRPIPKPAFDTDDRPDVAGLIDEPIIEAVAVIEDDEIVIPAEAVEIINKPEPEARPGHNRLCIEMLGEARFKGGERTSVGFLVSRGSSRKVVPGAEIMVKILGSSFRPVIFHALTDVNGVATVNMQMPSFSTGRAAFLVRAISEGEEIELRRSIAHG